MNVPLNTPLSVHHLEARSSLPKAVAAMEYIPVVGAIVLLADALVARSSIQKDMKQLKGLSKNSTEHVTAYNNIVQKKVIPYTKHLTTIWNRTRWIDLAAVIVSITVNIFYPLAGLPLTVVSSLSLFGRKAILLFLEPNDVIKKQKGDFEKGYLSAGMHWKN